MVLNLSGYRFFVDKARDRQGGRDEGGCLPGEGSHPVGASGQTVTARTPWGAMTTKMHEVGRDVGSVAEDHRGRQRVCFIPHVRLAALPFPNAGAMIWLSSFRSKVLKRISER